MASGNPPERFQQTSESRNINPGADLLFQNLNYHTLSGDTVSLSNMLSCTVKETSEDEKVQLSLGKGCRWAAWSSPWGVAEGLCSLGEVGGEKMGRLGQKGTGAGG